MYLLFPLGTNDLFQSAMTRLGHRSWAARKARLNRNPRERQSPRPVGENFTLNHNVGRSLVCSITLSMAPGGYRGSRREIMSLVPRAITTAVTRLVIFFRRTKAPSVARRPTFASIETIGHIFSASVFVRNDPNHEVPTVRLSPMTNKVSCPLTAMDAFVVCGRKIGTPINTTMTTTTIRAWRERNFTQPLWQG